MLSVYFPFTLSFPLIVRLSESNLPESKLSMVVFPEPEGPKMAVNVKG
jgi:hypothetical protein